MIQTLSVVLSVFVEYGCYELHYYVDSRTLKVYVMVKCCCHVW